MYNSRRFKDHKVRKITCDKLSHCRRNLLDMRSEENYFKKVVIQYSVVFVVWRLRVSVNRGPRTKEGSLLSLACNLCQKHLSLFAMPSLLLCG